MMQNSKRKVKNLGQLTEAFGAERGDTLSTALFNIVLEKVMRNTQTNLKGTISNRTRQHKAYADEVLILGRSVTATE